MTETSSPVPDSKASAKDRLAQRLVLQQVSRLLGAARSASHFALLQDGPLRRHTRASILKRFKILTQTANIRRQLHLH